MEFPTDTVGCELKAEAVVRHRVEGFSEVQKRNVSRVAVFDRFGDNILRLEQICCVVVVIYLKK